MTRKSLQLFAPLPQGGIDPQTPHTDLPVTSAYSADVVKHQGGAFDPSALSITREGSLLELDIRSVKLISVRCRKSLKFDINYSLLENLKI